MKIKIEKHANYPTEYQKLLKSRTGQECDHKAVVLQMAAPMRALTPEQQQECHAVIYCGICGSKLEIKLAPDSTPVCYELN